MYVQKNGSMYIKDIGTGAAVCEIAIPPTHNLQSPWEPIFTIGGGGRYLFVKGKVKYNVLSQEIILFLQTRKPEQKYVTTYINCIHILNFSEIHIPLIQ